MCILKHQQLSLLRRLVKPAICQPTLGTEDPAEDVDTRCGKQLFKEWWDVVASAHAHTAAPHLAACPAAVRAAAAAR